jgi:hypothetical protein
MRYLGRVVDVGDGIYEQSEDDAKGSEEERVYGSEEMINKIGQWVGQFGTDVRIARGLEVAVIRREVTS